MKQLFFSLVFFVPSLVSAQAYAGECGSCVDRKQRICADECELVSPAKARSCQQRCITDYCRHQCNPDAPELAAYLGENCDDCLEKQYGLCEVHCSVGTPRKKAACQIDCSADRCAKVCEAPAAEPAKTPATQ